MPTIDISLKDLQQLVGKKFSAEELESEVILYAKGEVDGIDGDTIKVDCKDTNRPDLWSTEGLARLLALKYTEESGIREYKIEESDVYIHIDRSVDNIRPFLVAAIVKDLKVTDTLIKQLIQIQEKVCLTYGRKRKMLSMGIYDFDKVTAPLTYKAVKPTAMKFTPLEEEKEMTLKEILEVHPKGKEYGHLIKDYPLYPLFVDSKNKVLSMPPIINSNESGKVTDETKNLFIELTGYNLKAIKVGLNIVVAALADRGGKIYDVEIDYGEKKIRTPDFTPKKAKVRFEEIERITGLKLSLKELKELLNNYGYNVKKAKDAIEVEYPSWRQDILHPVDIIEDILIASDYNAIEPLLPKIATQGSIDEKEIFYEKARNLLVGFGAQELLNFTLTSKDVLFKKMNIKEFPNTEIANPVSQRWTTLRNWLLPSLMNFFERNTSQEYPQQIYEVGQAIIIDEKAETGTRTVTRLAWAQAANNANFTKAKQILDFVLSALGLEYHIEETEHNSFISGRCARVSVKGKKVAYIGEIHPQVLENFGIEFPICAFELNLTELFDLQKD